MPTPDMSIWTGRVDHADGPRALRWHQMVRPHAPDSPPGIVLIGFACDEGVRRNGGRVGAKDGPNVIRKALANLAWHQEQAVYDAGDVRCDDGAMEGAQSRLAEVVAESIRSGHRPLILGGGHEAAWGTFQGIAAAKPDATIGVINIDAHLDLRADEPGNSGTPFNQMAKWCAANDRPFLYLPVGIATTSNTLALFDKAKELGVDVVNDLDCRTGGQAYDRCDTFARSTDAIYLSIDLDVLPGSVMPAVSSPAAGGVPLDAVESLIGVILDTGLVVAVDVVELNPRFDVDGQGARVAARIAYKVATEWE
jgi:formiminoglutamase